VFSCLVFLQRPSFERAKKNFERNSTPVAIAQGAQETKDEHPFATTSSTAFLELKGENSVDKLARTHTRATDENKTRTKADTLGIWGDATVVDDNHYHMDKNRKNYHNEDENTNQDTKSQSSSNYFKFEERRFFASPFFKSEIKEEAFRRIYAAIELPLKVLEDHGYEAYRQYVQGCDSDDDYDGFEQSDAGNHNHRVRNKRLFRGVFSKFQNKNAFRKNEKQKEELIRNSLKNALVNGDPREYQRTIFEVAKKRNTIVNLGTGAGKTLIALLLIRETWSSKTSSSPDEKASEIERIIPDGNLIDLTSCNGNAKIMKNDIKKNAEESRTIAKKTEKQQTLFLVPSVALAIQQSLTLRANLPQLHVETACYTSANSKRTRLILGKCDVIVATHGVIQDLLMHYGDTFRMDRFNLLVIDECHYAASGNHTYRHLMNKFYHPLEIEKRPRILGLTASPLLNVKENHSDEQLSTMLDTLERTLDSKMVSASGLTVSQELDDRLGQSNDPSASAGNNNILNRIIDERTLDYRSTNICRAIPSADNLKLLPSRYREFKQLEQLYKDLGPLVSAIYSTVLRRELSKNTFENESILQFDTALNHLERIEEFCNQQIKILPNMGRNDKIMALEELIETLVEERGGTKTVGLVFVERRITAMALHCYFRWRNQQILDRNSPPAARGWIFAKEARHDICKSDAIFQLKLSRNEVDQSDDEDGQFDDSADDPLHALQKRNKFNTRKTQIYSGFEGKMEENDMDFFNKKTQFIDAESESEEGIDNATSHKTKYFFRDRLCRVAIKSIALVRNPVQIFNSLSISQNNFKESDKVIKSNNWIHRESNVRDVLNKLRRGDMNLMFATSVVEEGVDVQACSFVVAFDGLTNIKGYIQMKGRARKQDAKFFVFRDPHDNRRSRLELCVAQKMERRVQRFIEERMRVYAPIVHSISSDYEPIEGITAIPKELRAIEIGVYKVGDATVDIQSAKSLLNRYFLSIPLDPFVRCKKESLLAYMPYFESNRLVLPVHLPSDMRIVTLPSKYNTFPRREKQKLLSLMACVRLQCYGLLNERLLPLTRKDMHSRILHDATQQLGKIETVTLDLDSFYINDSRHFMIYPFHQESSLLSRYRDKLNGDGRSLGLITASRIRTIEPFQLYHSDFGMINVSVGEGILVSCSSSESNILQQISLLLINSRWSRKSRNLFYEMRTQDQYDAVISPYHVGILSSNGELDWDFMIELLDESKRSVEERTNAARAFSSTEQLPKPRVWCTSYNEFLPYIVFGPTGESCEARVPDDMKGVNTYREYFKEVYSLELSSESPLFRVHRIWSLPSGLPTKSRFKDRKNHAKDDYFDFVAIPLDVCIEEPLANAYIAFLCIFLPQFLFIFERQQKTEAFITHCEINIPTLGNCFRKMDFSKVALAITTKSCNPDENYDCWEWVGDAVLKLLQTDSILKSTKFKHFVRFLHEGDLSMLRSSMGTNERLKQVNTFNCYKYVLYNGICLSFKTVS